MELTALLFRMSSTEGKWMMCGRTLRHCRWWGFGQAVQEVLQWWCFEEQCWSWWAVGALHNMCGHQIKWHAFPGMQSSTQ